MPHMTTFSGALGAWVVMSIVMMAPVAAILSWRHQKSMAHVGASLLGFVGVWSIVGIPAAMLVEAYPLGTHVAVMAIAIAAASAYQFSRVHIHALDACMNVSQDNGVRYGISVGTNCVVACGPLMIVAFWVMPSSLAPMVALTFVMGMEFFSRHRVLLSRVVGLAGAVLAGAVLLLPGVTSHDVVHPHVHH